MSDRPAWNDVSDLKDDLTACINDALEGDAMARINKAIRDLSYDLQEHIECEVKDSLAGNLAAWVAEMAKRTVAAILQGNEQEMRRYLSCEKRGESGEYIGWTGRSDSNYWGRKRDDHEWHSVIHGQLFEQGAIRLRKEIVDAHRDILVNERILDLEDQVRSLVAQVNKANAEKEAMWERVRSAA